MSIHYVLFDRVFLEVLSEVMIEHVFYEYTKKQFPEVLNSELRERATRSNYKKDVLNSARRRREDFRKAGQQ